MNKKIIDAWGARRIIYTFMSLFGSRACRHQFSVFPPLPTSIPMKLFWRLLVRNFSQAGCLFMSLQRRQKTVKALKEFFFFFFFFRSFFLSFFLKSFYNK